MLTGKSFRLRTETLGVETNGGNRSAVMVPADSVVEVTSGPAEKDPRMVQVRWQGRTVVMFAEDIQRRGEEIPASRASA